ncbi:MAG: hypothetical protein ABIQ65_14935, partial [Thermoanaerobaculia bacterium]
MRAAMSAFPTLSRGVRSLAEVVEKATRTVDHLYETGRFHAAENLDALLTEAEEFLEDVGDFEEGGDFENDLLSEVDEEGAHEFATGLPEDETHD